MDSDGDYKENNNNYIGPPPVVHCTISHINFSLALFSSYQLEQLEQQPQPFYTHNHWVQWLVVIRGVEQTPRTTVAWRHDMLKTKPGNRSNRSEDTASSSLEHVKCAGRRRRGRGLSLPQTRVGYSSSCVFKEKTR